MRRPSAARGKNWTPRWPTTRRNASGEQVAAAHRSKKTLPQPQSCHVNAKNLEASAQRPDRQAQVEHFAAQKVAFMELEVSWYKIFHGKKHEIIP
jgi:hypothetical protein